MLSCIKIISQINRTVLIGVPFFFAVCILLGGCGDLGADPVLSDARFSRTFRYYYLEECRYDAAGMYDCQRIESLSPAYVVRIRVDGWGEAYLNLDGTPYYYGVSDYSEDYESFSFYESDGEVTLYKDGAEMIIWDTWNSTAQIYSYSL